MPAKQNEKKREYSGLDSVFGRLQVTPPKGRIGVGDISGDTLVNLANDNKAKGIELLAARKLNEKRRRRHKCVIRKARLILPKTFTVKNKGDNVNKDDLNKDDVFVSDFNTSVLEAPITCSIQYLQQSSSSQTSGSGSPSTEDSSPDELASYFEQILYIPKPMSLMAQMMYA